MYDENGILSLSVNYQDLAPWPLAADGGDYTCLLYTSDAADERSSVDLGGRRIIKKKTWLIVGRRRLHSMKYYTTDDYDYITINRV